MKRARLIFGVAAGWGFLVLTPLLFAEPWLAPRPNRPEDYYGFLGAAWSMQLVYLAIARDPVRFRPLMPVGVLAKASFFLTVLVLWGQGRTPGATMAFAAVDGLLCLGFFLAWRATPKAS